MKKVVLFSLMLVSFVGYSQSPNEKKDKKPTNTNQIYTAVETQPNYPGGMDEFRKFVAKNYSSEVDKDIKGKVLIQFVVEEDGSLSDIKAVRDLGYGTGEEVIRVLKLSEKWKPGIQNGKPVRVRYTLPIDIDIKAKDKKPTNTNQIYTTVETQPNYSGGLDDFRKFIAQNYQSPKVDKDIKGKVLVQFVVEEDGSLSDIKVIRDLGYGTGEEAIRVLKLSKKWNPGYQNGKPVRVRYTLPIDVNIKAKN